MVDFTLHSIVESGNCYKPALMLQLCKADWQTQWVNFFDGEHKSAEFLAQNSMGEIPLLIDHTNNDLSVSQSGVILYHLAKHFGQFGPDNDAEDREIMRWILFDNHKLTGNLSVYRFMHKFLGKGDTAEAIFMKGRMVQAFKLLEAHLTGRDWVAADRATIADFSLAGYLFWPDHFSTDWDDYPAIKGWLERISNLPNYQTPEALLPAKPAA